MPDDITRIEFEPLGDGRFRWRLWAGTRLTHDEVSRPETIEAMFETTRLICTHSPGDDHEKEAHSEGTDHREKTDRPPHGLG